jgi:hypothetical protein
VRYDQLMEVVDMLNQLKRSDGTRLSKLSFVEAAGG